MLSYLHRYHAGSFADVHKHLILLAILQHLQKKPTPFCVLDTHAGEGIYDLHSPESEKNGEYKQGIMPLLKMKHKPALVQDFADIIDTFNPELDKRYYPGSPAIIQHFLRAQDNAIFLELHPQAAYQLQHHFRHEKHIHIHRRDAMEGLIALTPFKEKRGLIFIDPSYEVKDEYRTIPETVIKTYSCFSQGIYAIWYPMLAEKYHEVLLDQFARAKFEKIWTCEWVPYPHRKPAGIYGSGMVVINPPWGLDEVINETFDILSKNCYVSIAP